jgi:SAM-dependent methyltransferase
LDLQKQASKYYRYHSVDLGNGVIIDGDYDIREVLLHYGFPERMDGMDALDVGRGSGFFAFEFQRRRAAVTAMDICSFFDWDFVGGDEQREARRKAIGDEQGFTVEYITGAFEFASGVRKSRVTSKLINVYEMSPSGVRQPKVRSCFCGIHYFAPPRPDPCIRKAVQADQAPLHRGVALVRGPGCRAPSGQCAWLAPHGLGPPELLGEERHVPNRGAALRWIQAGSYRLPIHLAKPARPISEGTASGSARGRVGRLERWHGLCERPIRFIGQI